MRLRVSRYRPFRVNRAPLPAAFRRGDRESSRYAWLETDEQQRMQRMARVGSSVLLIALLLLTGCGGGGGGSNTPPGPTTVTIGGSVSGLTAGSMVLQNNSGD